MSSSFMLEVDFCSWHNWQLSAVIYLMTCDLKLHKMAVSVAVSNVTAYRAAWAQLFKLIMLFNEPLHFQTLFLPK